MKVAFELGEESDHGHLIAHQQLGPLVSELQVLTVHKHSTRVCVESFATSNKQQAVSNQTDGKGNVYAAEVGLLVLVLVLVFVLVLVLVLLSP